MGFSSYKCAVSKQSIPAACVEPCDVTVIMPDGTTHTGVYDGYGRVGDFDYYQALWSLLESKGLDLNSDATWILFEGMIRMIKTKYYDATKHTYKSLKPSKRCPDQGFFYASNGAWNKPAYKGQK